MIEITRHVFLRFARTKDEEQPVELLMNCVSDIQCISKERGYVVRPWFLDKVELLAVTDAYRKAFKSKNEVDVESFRKSIGNETKVCDTRRVDEFRRCITDFVRCNEEGRSKKLHLWEISPGYPYSLSLSLRNEDPLAVVGEFDHVGLEDDFSTQWIKNIIVQWEQAKVVDQWLS